MYGFWPKKCISSKSGEIWTWKYTIPEKPKLYEDQILRYNLNLNMPMTCTDCGKGIEPPQYSASIDALGVPLCERHHSLIQKVMNDNGTAFEAVQLFYALKEAGASPMLEWWDGKKSVDIAISRVKLNIEIDTQYNMITHTQALLDLEEDMQSFKNGFTSISIPHLVVKYYLEDTVRNIMGIINGLKANIKAI